MTVSGSAVTVLALTAAFAASEVTGRVPRAATHLGWASIPTLWPLVIATAVAGIVLAVRPSARRPAAAVAVVCALQVVGGGLAASRDWFNVAGAQGIPYHRLAVALPLTMAVVVAMTATLCIGVALLTGGDAATSTRKGVYFSAGAAIAVVFPLTITGGEWTVTWIGQVALTWSLPWGLCVMAAGWLDAFSRRAAVVAVTASASLMLAVFAW